MQNSWIPVRRGNAARQARVKVADLNEEHFSRQGFFGPASMLYHANLPANPIRVEGSISVAAASLTKLTNLDEDTPTGLPPALLVNDELSISISNRQAAMPFLLRNIDADTLLFVNAGSGVIATEFGPIEYEKDDFILIPKGVSYRTMPDSPSTFFVVESASPIRFTEHRQVGRHTPFDPGVLFIPDVVEYDWPAQDEWELKLKHGNETSSLFYDFQPFDLTGWKGDLFPLKLAMRDIRAITSERMHLAPSSWSIFESDAFMGVAFVPMTIVSDPDAEELPSRHRNVDTEEIVLMQTNNGAEVNILLHMPQGVTHGPTERGDYDALRRPGLARALVGFSVDAYKRVHRTPEFLQALASFERPMPK